MKKEILGLVIFTVIMAVIFAVAVDRFEKIDNGEMVLVNQNEMDR